jgi:translation initiation factor 4A
MTENNVNQEMQNMEIKISETKKKNDAFFVETKGNSQYQVTPVNSFDALNLKAELLRGIYGKGFSEPSGI